MFKWVGLLFDAIEREKKAQKREEEKREQDFEKRYIENYFSSLKPSPILFKFITQGFYGSNVEAVDRIMRKTILEHNKHLEWKKGVEVKDS